MRRPLAILVLRFLALGLLTAGFSAVAQPGAQEPTPRMSAEDLAATFSDMFEVQAARVDVVVTDGEENRVQGLTVNDFRLVIDGQEIEIESFAEIRDRQVVPPSSVIDPASAKFQLGNNYLIFIDEISSGHRLHEEALKGIAEDLRSLDPSNQVAIVAASRKGLKILALWAHGGPALDQFLARLTQHSGSLANSDLFLKPDDAPRRIEAALQGHLDRFFAEEAVTAGAVSDVQQELKPTEKATAAVTASLRAFSGVPGRKILLLLSSGWKLSPKAESGKSSELQRLADTANRLGFTVYPVHLTNGRRQPSLEQGSLEFTALETGGLLLPPQSNRHLGKVEHDAGASYRLGFTFSGDDRRRDLKVEIRRPGLQVRGPRNFVPLSSQAYVRQQVDNALIQGALAGMKPLAVSVGELRFTDKGRAELPVTVQIPIHQVEMLAAYAKSRIGQLELRMSALADDGSRTVITAVPIWVLEESESKPSKPTLYQATIQVEYKPQYVQLILVDVLSGKSFMKEVRVEPRPRRATGMKPRY